jgi:hypothetical protein
MRPKAGELPLLLHVLELVFAAFAIPFGLSRIARGHSVDIVVVAVGALMLLFGVRGLIGHARKRWGSR